VRVGRILKRIEYHVHHGIHCSKRIQENKRILKRIEYHVYPETHCSKRIEEDKEDFYHIRGGMVLMK
jgi:hypothetical protein